jgi:integrase/recombinase XerC
MIGASRPSLPAGVIMMSTAAHRAPDAVVPSTATDTLEALLERIDQVKVAWVASGEFSPQTLARAGEMADRFARRIHRQGLTDLTQVTAFHCQGFIDAATTAGPAPELTTRHARRTALRMIFRTLRDEGVDVGDPTMDLRLPPRSATTARPLTDAEITLGRASTRLGTAGSATLQRATVWALAEATAMTSEISTVRIEDVDDAQHPGWIRLPGTRHLAPRMGELSDWGARILTRQLRVLRDANAPKTTLLTYRGHGVPGQDKAQSATCNALGAVLDLAGLSDEPDVRPVSVRNWAGRALYEAGMPLERVATRMGYGSLDAAAAAIALDWRSA